MSYALLIASLVVTGALLGRTAWASQSVEVTRRHFVVVGLALGGLSSFGILLGAQALQNLNKERDARARALVREEERRLRGEFLSRSQVKRIARREARIERPSAQDIIRLIVRYQAVCQRSAKCRAAQHAALRASLGSLSTPALVPSPAPPLKTPPAQRGPKATTPSRHRPAPQRPSSPSRPPAAGPPPSSTGSPSPPNIVTPSIPLLPAVHVCTPVVGVNCPR